MSQYVPANKKLIFVDQAGSVSCVFIKLVEEVGAYLIGLCYAFFYTNYPILDKLFELCPFMQTHESPIDNFSSNSYPVSRNDPFRHHFCSARIAPIF